MNDRPDAWKSNGGMRLAIYEAVGAIVGREITTAEHDALKAVLTRWQGEVKTQAHATLQGLHNQRQARQPHQQSDPKCEWHRRHDEKETFHCANCCQHCNVYDENTAAKPA